MLSNGHSPQIRENGKLLVQMCQGESHFCQKWPLANVVEFGEYHKWSSLASIQNAFGEFGEFRNIYKLARFMYKTLILYVLNGIPYSP